MLTPLAITAALCLASQPAMGLVEPADAPCRVASACHEAQDAALRCWQSTRNAITDPFTRPPTHTPLRGTYLFCSNDDAWVALDAQPVPADLVLLIHGIDEVGPIWDNLAPQLAVRGYAVARFDYPNDQGLADSAALLHDELRSLRARGVVRITLIAHSMGGLIARDVLTSPDAYACRAAGHAGLPDITRLITVGTPNHGSPLARLRAVLEVKERIARTIRADGELLDLVRPYNDGDGQAGRDLRPQSTYLARLNARDLPLDLPITCIIGQVADPSDNVISRAADAPCVQEALGVQRISSVLRGNARLSAAVGDGVVTLHSAVLDQVEDTVIVNAGHRSLLRNQPWYDILARPTQSGPSPLPPAIPIILNRLQLPGAADRPGATGRL